MEGYLRPGECLFERLNGVEGAAQDGGTRVYGDSFGKPGSYRFGLIKNGFGIVRGNGALRGVRARV